MIGSLTTLTLFLAQHVLMPPPPPPPSTRGALPDYALLNAVTRANRGGSGSVGTASLPDGVDIQVNAPSTALQADSAILVDPTNRNHIICASNDTSSGPFQCQYYASFDGGATWVANVFPDPDKFGNSLSPAIAFGPGGVIYYAANAYSVSTGQTGMYVGTSTDGGTTVGNWVKAVPPGSNHSDDKPALAVDNTGGTYNGVIYLTFTRFGLSGNSPIMVTYSSDGGSTWSAPKQFSDSNVCQGSAPVVGLNGEVNCCFYDFSDNTIKFDVSLDGGVTWGVDVLAAHGKYLSTVPNTTFRTNSMPQMDIDRSGGSYTGTLYITMCCDKGTGTLSDVYVTHSYSGGATWSKLFMVNDNSANSQFFPALAVDSTGHVNVGWMDRRDDPSDISIKFYVSRSGDGGVTWDPNTAVSDVAFDPNSYPQGNYIGDYTGISSSERMVFAAWTDGRNGDDDVFMSPVNLDFHTDVDVVSAAAGGTVSFFLDAGSLYSYDDYRLLGSVTGNTPGIKLNGVPIPVNYDQFTLLTIIYANTPSFPSFSGLLTFGGFAYPQMVFPTLPASLIGLQFDFAAFVKIGNKCKWASASTHLAIVP